jgi:hypothetical protein
MERVCETEAALLSCVCRRNSFSVKYFTSALLSPES